ncbi:MAG: CDP-alcohol phosphatidyltransferase family protein [Parcubacteria group bacterium]|nr:CDP-alcohol phosphatidyltransferase family protein [Parcubacteria group bacterium]
MSWFEGINKKGQEWRAIWLKPIYQLLTALNVNSNHLTFLRFLAGPVFFFYFPVYPRKMTLLLIVAGLLDLVDGGLARYQKRESDRGKFWDVLVDHLTYVFAILALLSTQAFAATILGYQLLIAPVCYLLATIKESEGEKTDWIIHPFYSIVYFKPLVIAALLAYVIWGVDTMTITILLVNVWMTVHAVFDAITLAKRWKGR